MPTHTAFVGTSGSFHACASPLGNAGKRAFHELLGSHAPRHERWHQWQVQRTESVMVSQAPCPRDPSAEGSAGQRSNAPCLFAQRPSKATHATACCICWSETLRLITCRSTLGSGNPVKTCLRPLQGSATIGQGAFRQGLRHPHQDPPHLTPQGGPTHICPACML